MMDIHTAKQQLRSRMAALRDGMPQADREERSHRICRNGLELLLEEDANTGQAVLVYVPFRSEVNTWPLIRALWHNNRPVAAPRTNRAAGTLELFRIDDERQLIPGAWGIPEPDPAQCKRLETPEICAVIVPGLAFDRQGGRLGYGAGYYDRLFRSIDGGGQPMPLRIGVAFSGQVVEEVPMDGDDFPVDRIVTEEAAWPASGQRS